jgi:hypothetical protein
MYELVHRNARMHTQLHPPALDPTDSPTHCSQTLTRRACAQPLLVLHFDVNETIMVGDPAGGDTFEHSLNKIVCKSAFCQSEDPDTWHTGEAVVSGEAAIGLPAPPLHTAWEWPEGCAPIYRKMTRRQSKVEFTDRRGAVYKPLYDSLERALRWPEGEPVAPGLCHDGQLLRSDLALNRSQYAVMQRWVSAALSRAITKTNTLHVNNTCLARGLVATAWSHALCTRVPAFMSLSRSAGVHHFLLPAFFRTLAELVARRRRFRLVVRTFGTDGPKVSEALAAFARGEHCLHRGVVAPGLALDKDACYIGRCVVLLDM